jgi:hypothetical protein
MITFLLTLLVCDNVTMVPQCRWTPVEHYTTEGACRESGAIFKHTDQVLDFRCTVSVHTPKDQNRLHEED